MKVYNKVVIDIATGKTIYENSFEYSGPVAECKGGGTNTVDRGDPAYNARMATIAEQEAKWGQEYQDFWRQYAKPMEIMQIGANKELIPQQTELEKLKMSSESELLPARTAYEKSQMESATRLLPLNEQNVRTAMGGVQSMMGQANDINQHDYMGMYQADAAQGFVGAENQLKRDLARRGIAPGSPAYNTAMNKLRFEKAKQTGGARTMGRRAASTEKFNRTGAATQAASNLIRK